MSRQINPAIRNLHISSPLDKPPINFAEKVSAEIERISQEFSENFTKNDGQEEEHLRQILEKFSTNLPKTFHTNHYGDHILTKSDHNLTKKHRAWTRTGHILTQSDQILTKHHQIWTRNNQIFTKSDNIWTKGDQILTRSGHILTKRDVYRKKKRKSKKKVVVDSGSSHEYDVECGISATGERICPTGPFANL